MLEIAETAKEFAILSCNPQLCTSLLRALQNDMRHPWKDAGSLQTLKIASSGPGPVNRSRFHPRLKTLCSSPIQYSGRVVKDGTDAIQHNMESSMD